MTVRDIYYVKELEAHMMMPGRNGTINALLKKRHCSLCGQHSFRKNDWCPHLIKAGRSMNMKLDNITPRRRNLRELRRGARLEKVPGGSKRNQSLRKFDIVPLHTQLNNDQVQQEIIQDFNARTSGQPLWTGQTGAEASETPDCLHFPGLSIYFFAKIFYAPTFGDTA